MEFGRAARAGKLLMMALRPLLLSADYRVVSRLHEQMMHVLPADLSSARGQRNVVDGAIGLLTYFEFNNRSPLSSNFFAPHTESIDRVLGTVTLEIPSFVPTEIIMAAGGTTHYKIKSGCAALDFDLRTFAVAITESAVLHWNSAPTIALNHSHQVPAASTQPLFLAMCLVFYQEINGELYLLENGVFNSSVVLKVSRA